MTDDYENTSASDGYSVEYDDQLQPEDTLIDRGVDDILDEGISPPERPYARLISGDDDLDHRLAAEEPDISVEDAPEFASEDAEVGGRRAGRLVDPNLGYGEDTEAELIAEDVGISGGAASAEEAAVHIIPNEPDI